MSFDSKRNHQDILNYNTYADNGLLVSSARGYTDNSEMKRLKLDGEQLGTPSPVVHIRGLPAGAFESDIVQLGAPFGKVVNVLLLRGKNQAFLEMSDENTAANMVSFYNSRGAQIHGQSIHIQFSTHRELKLTPNTQKEQDASEPFGDQVNSTGGSNTILRILIDKLIYPVSLDTLHQVFSRYGQVMKIITFTKNNTFQALIQFPNAGLAQTAKTGLDGKNIYNGCCTLHIDYSKLTNLTVRYNDEKSWDYTVPDMQLGGNFNGQNIPGDGLLGEPVSYSQKGILPAVPGMSPFSASLSSLALKPEGNSVIIVSHLDEELATTDGLFTLFGVYGDIQRVKILRNKKDTALIQYSSSDQAQLAVRHLNQVKVWGHQIRVNLSKHQVVQLPKEGMEDDGLTQDYGGSPLHRYKKPGSKNFQNIAPPSTVLHLSNVGMTVSEDDIRNAFENEGCVVTDFKFFPKDRKMALVQLPTVEEAVNALIVMDNYELGPSHIRVSFTRSTF